MRAPEASMVMAQADAQAVEEPVAGDQPTGGENASSAVFDPDSDPDGSRAAEIVRQADEIRFPQQAFQVDVTVSSTSGGQELEPRLYRILSKGNENTIVQTLEPATERGQNMLMRGRELWVYMPSVSQPVRLSLSQRLTGQVANGDLARANFSGDYTAKLLRTETIDEHDYYVLELVAASRGVTYPKVVYWVRTDNHHPFKAEFHAVSGRLLKTCTYENFVQLGDRVRPTRLVMTDAVKEGERSILEYSELTPRELPNRMFTKDYMKRLD
ncbi:MAG: outer membrane lipoprotein-sorting protein [Limnobacter sp.]|nr:outer membrane lipoprotein-sorting protein [Limnobacter sp.]